MPAPPPPAWHEIRTRRLLLRRPTESDAPFVLALHADPRAVAHNPTDALGDLTQARSRIALWSSHWKQGLGYFLVEELAGGRPIGVCGVKAVDLHGQPSWNLLYRFLPEAWGRGYAAEAARASLDAAAAAVDASRPVIARIRPANAASARVAEAVGLVRRPDLDLDGDDGRDEIWSSAPRRRSVPMKARNADASAHSDRAVRFVESFGGPEALRVVSVPVPHAAPGQIRVRVTAAGLNPMDWFMTSDADTAARFRLSLPSGFGTDYAGVVDEVGEGVTGFAVGDRVFGGALSRTVADHVVVDPAGAIAVGGSAHHTPDGVDDRTAAALTIAGSTAAAALAVVRPGPGDTVLVGGAGGGVGVFVVQLARLAGARVIGTGSAASADALRELGAEPVTYGAGLVDRLRALAPDGITAALDLHGTDTAEVARELGIPDGRITTIAARVDGIVPANGAQAAPGALEEIARHIAAGRMRVPIAATFPMEEVRAAVELQSGRHVHGKVVIDI